MDASLRQDGSAFAALSAAQQQAALRNLMALAAKAKRDPALFIQRVARAEHGPFAGQPVIVAPHQQLMLRFVQQHRNCVLRMPVGSSKTFMMTFLGMWMLGRDLTSRGAIISAAQSQAKQPLALTRQYIESGRLALVFPELRRSPDPHAAWSSTELVVDRPGQMRNPSLRAIGIEGKIQGSRLSWALADDLLDGENTATLEQRNKIDNDLETQVMTRIDTGNGRCIVTNTPWDRDDVTYRLERRKWASLSMSVTGDVWFSNVRDIEGIYGDLLRPSRHRANAWRLLAHDPDPSEQVTIWPLQYNAAWMAEKKLGGTPFNWARFYECQPFDSGAARCQREWADDALKAGRGLAFPAERTRMSPTYTGVDVGGVRKGHDKSSICTIEVLDHDDPRKQQRRILNLQSGHWSGPELISRIINEAAMYDSHVFVESNGAQKFIADFASDAARNLRVTKFDTGKNKYDETFGVEAVFAEMMRGQWVWPSNAEGEAYAELEELANECVFYDPARHTGDRLMALFLARQGLSRHRTKVARQGGVGGQRLHMGIGGGF